MSGQSFKQVVEDLAGTPPKPVVYRFNGEAEFGQVSLRKGKRKLPTGHFEEDTIHGAYGITVVDGEIV